MSVLDSPSLSVNNKQGVKQTIMSYLHLVFTILAGILYFSLKYVLFYEMDWCVIDSIVIIKSRAI